MEQETIKNSIIERFNNLQPEIQEAIMNTNYENILIEIGNKYNLTKEQMGELEFNTTLVMLGQTHPDNYEKELMEDLKIPEVSIKGIVVDVNEKILKNIIDLLKNNFKEEEQIGFDPTFSGFPEKVQEAIANSGWKEKLYGIANKYKLTVSQMGILEEVTIQVMRNEIHPNEYEGELSSRITTPKEDISSIVKDVNTEILVSIRELLKGNISENKQTKNLSAQTEEVPLPPYAKIITNDKLLINNKIKKVPESYKPTEIPIENINIPVNTPKNIIEEKLKGATISNHSVSDYSTPKISTPEAEGKPKAFDPYRESF